MPQHVIRFTGKISWEGRVNGLPDEIYAFLTFDKYDREAFNNAIVAQSEAFVRSQVMVVQRDQGQIIDLNQMPQERMLVPFKWIVNISVAVHPVVGEISIPDEDGIELLKDGTEPVKQ